jgi:hypothetical protein
LCAKKVKRQGHGRFAHKVLATPQRAIGPCWLRSLHSGAA